MTDRGGFVAAGGFGCLAKPGLKCKNPREDRRPGVSKLMTSERAFDEWERIETLKSTISKIPNYKNYFLFGTSICEQPVMYTGVNNELNDFNNIEKCSEVKGFRPNDAVSVHPKLSLQERIQKFSNVSINDDNKSGKYPLNFSSINMPDGGEDVHTYLQRNLTRDEFIALNEAIIRLIINGIQPLNEDPVGILHSDVRTDNVLYDVKTGYARLIDWGLSYKSGIYREVPWGFEIHYPYTNILYDPNFKKPPMRRSVWIGGMVKPVPPPLPYNYRVEDDNGEVKSSFPAEKVETFIKNENGYILNNITVYGWNKSRPHFKDVFPKLDLDKLSNQLAIIFTNMSRSKYYEDIYSKNADIYGLIITYYIDLKIGKINGRFDFINEDVLDALFEKFIWGDKYLTNPYDKESIKSEFRKLAPPSLRFRASQYCTKAMALAGLCAMGAAVAAPYFMGGKKTKKRKVKSKPKPKKNTRRNHKNKKSRRKNKKNYKS